MTERDDIALLREFAATESESAFAALVEQHVNLVYSTALRSVGGAHAAQEITQAVFIILARKAKSLGAKTVLAGWLHQTTRLTAANFLRGEIRRQQREQEAYMQSTLNEPDASVWPQIAPLLDEALDRLGERDRHAVVLRFFENKNLREVGAALGASEDAAKMRVNRALEKLRKMFAKRGMTLTAAAIAGAVSANSVHAAPAGLAKIISTVAVAKGAAASASTLTLIKGALKIMAWTKAKTAIVSGVVVLLAAGTATVTVKEIQEHRTHPWQVRNFDSRVLEQVPPQVMILPTIFPDSESWGSANGKLLGSGASVQDILRTTYGMSSARTVLSVEPPPGKYDYIANLPRGSVEALQTELKRKFGVVGRREMRETDVLLLTVKYKNARGLKPSANHRNSSSSNEGSHYSFVNLPLSSLTDYLEYYLKIPVVDQTGLTNRFDIDLQLDEQDWQQRNPASLKQALVDQFGLELLSGREPVEMLVVEKAK
jgi:uncharacterized protein (TIGR03435 family)